MNDTVIWLLLFCHFFIHQNSGHFIRIWWQLTWWQVHTWPGISKRKAKETDVFSQHQSCTARKVKIFFVKISKTICNLGMTKCLTKSYTWDSHVKLYMLLSQQKYCPSWMAERKHLAFQHHTNSFPLQMLELHQEKAFQPRSYSFRITECPLVSLMRVNCFGL